MNRKMKNAKFVYGAVSLGIVLVVIGISISLFCCKQKPKTEDPLLKYCSLKGKMDSGRFNNFLIHLSNERMDNLMDAIELNQKNRDRTGKYREITEWLNWQSKNWAIWLVTDKTVDYDEIVRWTAKKLKVENVETLSTFKLERKILNSIFEKIWDKMTPEQRQRALKNMKESGDIKNIADISALTGSGALAALSETAAFSGFAFYTGMSSFLCSAAPVLGISLPFPVSMTPGTTIAALAGPIGWCIAAIEASVGNIFIVQADYQKTARLIIALHLIKVDAIQKSGYDVKDFLETRSAKTGN